MVIKYFYLLLATTVFFACNPTNQTKKEDINNNASSTPTMNIKEQNALSDTDETTKMATSTKSQSANKGSAKVGGAMDLTSGNIKESLSNRAKSDEEILRDRLERQVRDTENKKAKNPIDTEPAPGKKTASKTVQNAKVSTPTNKTINNTTTTVKDTKEIPTIINKPNHAAWNSLLQQYVSATGQVDYRGLKMKQQKLNEYLVTLKQNPPADDWSRNEKMAFWINAYNAFTVKKIIDNYPLNSIMDLSNGKVWDDKWIQIGQRSLSLNDIENSILRPNYNDARIHFAVNCAAKSCPPLHNEAFTAANLERKLENLTTKFINNKEYTVITRNEVKVSKIFDWYGEDFRDLIEYLNQYSDTKIDDDTEIEYLEYNWDLNNK